MAMLKNDANPPGLWWHIDAGCGIKKGLTGQFDAAAVWFLEPGQEVHQGRLATAGWSEDATAIGSKGKGGGKKKVAVSFFDIYFEIQIIISFSGFYLQPR
jgi:hypothetical protein